MSDDLLIKIGADISDASDKLSQLGDGADKLEGKLADVAKISAVALRSSHRRSYVVSQSLLGF